MIAALVATLFLSQAPTAESLSEQALSMAQQGRPADAEKLWKQALQLQPRLFTANFNLGYFYFSRQQPREALPLLLRAVQSQPKDFNARYLAGATHSQLGNVDDALRQWRAAIVVRPDHGKLLQAMAVEYAKGRYFRDSAAAAERALALAPGDPNLYLLAIKARQDAQDRVIALQLSAKMLAQFPDHPRAQFEHGYELIRAGRVEEGMPYLQKSMASPAAWEEPFYFYAEALIGQGKHAEAIPPLKEAIARRRDYIAAWTLLARTQIRLGRLDDAKAALLEAASIHPKHPQPHVLLAQVYFRLGDEEQAAREKELSIRLRREDPGALETLPGRAFPHSER